MGPILRPPIGNADRSLPLCALRGGWTGSLHVWFFTPKRQFAVLAAAKETFTNRWSMIASAWNSGTPRVTVHKEWVVT
jgi:hypothetical protein